MIGDPVHIMVALLTAGAVMGAFLSFFPLPKRLRDRVRPYTDTGGGLPNRLQTGRLAASAPVQVFGPMVMAASRAVGKMAHPMGEDRLALMVRQAKFYPGLADRDRVASYRLAALGAAVAFAALGAVATTLLGQSTLTVLAASLGLGVAGALRVRGRLDRALENRRSVMKVEIATINQLLAIRVRAGSGPVHAVGDLVARGRGEVIEELGEALRMHRSGVSASEAFRRLAEATPETHCARTYKLLASAEEMGADLTAGLRALAEDARRARREALRRSAIRRRSAMLVPTIAILAPVMLLFVAAPLPQLVLGWK